MRLPASPIRRIVNLAITITVLGVPVAALASSTRSVPEEIEWTWEVRPTHVDAHLPNVLLVGDSITRNYYPEVKKDLAGLANVYLMASSTCVGDPRLPRQIAEFSQMEGVPFRVVHFNNGMHGWGYTEAQYKAAFPGFVHSIAAVAQKDGTLIWANTTPVRADANNGATNERIHARNQIALAIIHNLSINVDDQHALMMKHQDLHEDSVHFNPQGANIQGDQAAALIRAALRIPEK